MTRLAEHRRELVEQAAIRADKTVFGFLADLRQLNRIDIDSEEVAESERGGDLKRSRR